MAGQYEDLGMCPERASTNAGPWRETSEPRSEEYVLELSCMLATAVMCPGWVYVPPNILDPRDPPSVFVGLNWTATKKTCTKSSCMLPYAAVFPTADPENVGSRPYGLMASS